MNPILSLDEFKAQHRAVQTAIDKARLTRTGRWKLSDEVIEEMMDRSSKELYSNNMRARYAFARALNAKLRALVDDPDLEFCMVTIAPEKFTRPLGKARDLKLGLLKTLVRESLVGFSYVGLVEAALYPRCPLFSGPTVSWHAHCLVWGFDRAKLDKRLRRLNREMHSAVPGLEPAHLRELTPGGALSRAFYISKGPIRQYQAYERMTLNPGWDDEAETPDSKKYFHQKTPIRPGNAMKMAMVMQGRKLPELAIVGGHGVPLLGTVIERARGIIRSVDQKKHQRLLETIQ